MSQYVTVQCRFTYFLGGVVSVTNSEFKVRTEHIAEGYLLSGQCRIPHLQEIPDDVLTMFQK